MSPGRVEKLCFLSMIGNRCFRHVLEHDQKLGLLRAEAAERAPSIFDMSKILKDHNILKITKTYKFNQCSTGKL